MILTERMGCFHGLLWEDHIRFYTGLRLSFYRSKNRTPYSADAVIYFQTDLLYNYSITENRDVGFRIDFRKGTYP